MAVRRAPNGPLDPAQCLPQELRTCPSLNSQADGCGAHTAFCLLLGEHHGCQWEHPVGEGAGGPRRNAFRAFLVNQIASGARVGVILDNPMLPQPPAECVAQTGSITDYEPSRSAVLGPGQNLSSAELQVLSRLKSVPNISPASLLCDASGCPLERHGSRFMSTTTTSPMQRLNSLSRRSQYFSGHSRTPTNRASEKTRSSDNGASPRIDIASYFLHRSHQELLPKNGRWQWREPQVSQP